MLQKPKSKLFHFGYAKIERFAAFVNAIVIVVICILIAYQAYQKIIYSGVGIINPQFSTITLIQAGTNSLPRDFRKRHCKRI